MPGITIHTNIKDNHLPDDFEEKIVEKICEIFNSPSELVYLTVSTGNRMINNGKMSPMIFVDVKTVKGHKTESNDHYSRELIPFFSTLLNLPDTRVVISYIEADDKDFGMVRRAPEFQHEEFYCGIND